MALIVNYRNIINDYENSLLLEEKNHFRSASYKALTFINNFKEYFVDKSVLDYGCYMGYTSFVFSLFAHSVDCFDINPNCKYVFDYNNPNSNKLRWQSFDELKFNYYDTVFMYGVAQSNKDPKEWLEYFVENVNFSTLIISDGDKDDNWYKQSRKIKSIVAGLSANYDYSVDGFSLSHIDDYLPKVSNLHILDRIDNLQFPNQGFSNVDPRDLSNESKKIIYVCKKN